MLGTEQGRGNNIFTLQEVKTSIKHLKIKRQINAGLKKVAVNNGEG